MDRTLSNCALFLSSSQVTSPPKAVPTAAIRSRCPPLPALFRPFSAPPARRPKFLIAAPRSL